MYIYIYTYVCVYITYIYIYIVLLLGYVLYVYVYVHLSCFVLFKPTPCLICYVFVMLLCVFGARRLVSRRLPLAAGQSRAAYILPVLACPAELLMLARCNGYVFANCNFSAHDRTHNPTQKPHNGLKRNALYDMSQGIILK